MKFVREMSHQLAERKTLNFPLIDYPISTIGDLFIPLWAKTA